MPDAIASYSVGGTTYVITANEGDAREYTGYSEIGRMSSSTYPLDPTAFPNGDVIKANIGRLNITMANGDSESYQSGSRRINKILSAQLVNFQIGSHYEKSQNIKTHVSHAFIYEFGNLYTQRHCKGFC
jgi:hypothetical protein